MIKIQSQELWWIVVVFICLVSSRLQANDLDSLKKALNSDIHDTTKMELLYRISLEASSSNPVEAMEHANKYLDLAHQLGVKHEIVSANNHIGILYYSLGDLSKTIEYFTKSSNLLDEQEDAVTKSRLLNNLAIVYDEMQQYDKAIEYYKASINQKQELGLSGDNLSSTFSNLALSYINNKQFDSAYHYLWTAHAIDLTLGDSSILASSIENLGIYHSSIGSYDSAVHYIEKAKDIALTIGEEEYLLSDIYNRLGKIYLETRDYSKAKINYEKALQLATDIEVSQIVIASYLGLAETAKADGDYKSAYQYFESFTSLKDSIFTEDAKSKLEGVETDFQVQKKEQEIKLLTQASEIDRLELARNQQLQYFLMASVLLLVFIVILYYHKNKFKVKTLKILEEQKNKIADKNKEILDSIHYAKGIQEAMLPSDKEFNQLFSNGFIFYQATEMVTGDFFWASETKDGSILAVVDCTGHGVPGALLTVLANSIITDLVKERGITSPAQILSGLHQAMLTRLHQTNGNVLQSNGLDAAVCYIPKQNSKLIYAGAKRPLYYIHDGQFEVTKGNYYSVGTPYYEEKIDYDDHEINMSKGDLFYLFTDGLVDQFGGEKGKKFLGKRLRQLLMDIHLDNADEQKNKVESTIQNWMGSQPQIDDMLLIGVKL